jgi:hypothetical protein
LTESFQRQLEKSALEQERDKIRELHQRQQDSILCLQALEGRLSKVVLDDGKTLQGSTVPSRVPTLDQANVSALGKVDTPAEKSNTIKIDISATDSETSDNDATVTDEEDEHLSLAELAQAAKHVHKLLKRITVLQRSFESDQKSMVHKKRRVHKIYQRFCRKWESNIVIEPNVPMALPVSSTAPMRASVPLQPPYQSCYSQSSDPRVVVSQSNQDNEIDNSLMSAGVDGSKLDSGVPEQPSLPSFDLDFRFGEVPSNAQSMSKRKQSSSHTVMGAYDSIVFLPPEQQTRFEEPEPGDTTNGASMQAAERSILVDTDLPPVILDQNKRTAEGVLRVAPLPTEAVIASSAMRAFRRKLRKIHNTTISRSSSTPKGVVQTGLEPNPQLPSPDTTGESASKDVQLDKAQDVQNKGTAATSEPHQSKIGLDVSNASGAFHVNETRFQHERESTRNVIIPEMDVEDRVDLNDHVLRKKRHTIEVDDSESESKSIIPRVKKRRRVAHDEQTEEEEYDLDLDLLHHQTTQVDEIMPPPDVCFKRLQLTLEDSTGNWNSSGPIISATEIVLREYGEDLNYTDGRSRCRRRDMTPSSIDTSRDSSQDRSWGRLVAAVADVAGSAAHEAPKRQAACVASAAVAGLYEERKRSRSRQRPISGLDKIAKVATEEVAIEEGDGKDIVDVLLAQWTISVC